MVLAQMALDRFYNLPLGRREEILTIAAETFAEKGFDETSYNELLLRLSMGKSQAYYYFADKADLFITASIACYEAYYEEVSELPWPGTAKEFWEYVRLLHLVGFRFQKTHPLAAKLTRAAARSQIKLVLAQASIDGAASTADRYREWLSAGQQLGAIRTDLADELLLTLATQNAAMVDAWFAERAETASAQEMQKWADDFTDMLKRMFAPAPIVAPCEPPAKKGSRRTKR